MAGLLTPAREDREGMLAHGLRLEAFTLAYNIVEAAVALAAAWLAGSVALLGFGADSVVESLSAAVLAWRLHREQQGIPEQQIARIEQRAQRLVAVSLIALGLFVAAEATRTLVVGRLPGTSWIGIGLTSLSLVVMFVLARAKRSTARALGSRAMEGDAFHTDACFLTAGLHWVKLSPPSEVESKEPRRRSSRRLLRS